ncbi:mCG1050267, partial [Mus musculus]
KGHQCVYTFGGGTKLEIK